MSPIIILITNSYNHNYNYYHKYNHDHNHNHDPFTHIYIIYIYRLTYWVVFAFFNMLEFAIDFVLYLFPFYWIFKLVFWVWCFLPSTRGSTVVYEQVIYPASQAIRKTASPYIQKATTGIASEMGVKEE